MTPASIHAHFATLPGHEQMATAFACEALPWWIRRVSPHRVLEVGAGIGTLTAMLRSTLPAASFLHSIEDDPWCRAAVVENAAGFGPSQWAVWTHAEWSALHVEESGGVNLLVLDGGRRSDDYTAVLAPHAVVFVEGGRRDQRRAMRTHLARRDRRWAEATWRPPDRSKGYTVIQCEPTWVERCWFGAVRIREWFRDRVAARRGVAVGKRRREPHDDRGS